MESHFVNLLSCPNMSHHVPSSPIISQHVPTCPIMSQHVPSYPNMPHHVLTCPNMSHHVPSCDCLCPGDRRTVRPAGRLHLGAARPDHCQQVGQQGHISCSQYWLGWSFQSKYSRLRKKNLSLSPSLNFKQSRIVLRLAVCLAKAIIRIFIWVNVCLILIFYFEQDISLKLKCMYVVI